MREWVISCEDFRKNTSITIQIRLKKTDSRSFFDVQVLLQSDERVKLPRIAKKSQKRINPSSCDLLKMRIVITSQEVVKQTLIQTLLQNQVHLARQSGIAARIEDKQSIHISQR